MLDIGLALSFETHAEVSRFLKWQRHVHVASGAHSEPRVDHDMSGEEVEGTGRDGKLVG